MIKQKLLATIVGLSISLSALSAQATGWPVYDVMRTAKFGGQGVQRLLGLISEYQKTAADDAELEVLEKKRNIEHLPEKQMLDYWNTAKPTEMETNTLMPGQNDIETAKSYLRENYFLPADTVEGKVCKTTITEQQRREMKQKRQKYVEAMAKETLSLADGTRKNIAGELTALKEAETTGAAQVQQIDLMVQTKKAMVEQKIADLYLQTRMMEMEAMSMLMGLSMQLAENPEDGKDVCTNNQVWTVGGES